MLVIFFFQAEDGIRDYKVTGVQTCALPIYVRNLPTGREPAHDAGQHVEAPALAELLAAREEQLIAEADAEKRAAAVERATQRRRQAKTVEIGHRIVKRAVAGKDHGIGVVHRLRVLGHDGVHADPFEGLLDRAEIASAVIADVDHSVPMVEGRIPAMRGLSRVASASARPTALKTASVTWCKLWP